MPRGRTGIESTMTGAEIKALYESEVSAFTDALFTKLAGIEAGATADQTGAEIKALYESEVSAFTDALFTKLAGIEAGATADQTGAEIKALYELESNAFTNALFTKLAGIEAGATADQTGAEIQTLYEARVGAVIASLDYSRVARNSTTQFQAEGLDSSRTFIMVNGSVVDLSTPTTCDVSGGSVRNLIDADGSDSGGTPAANTAYHVYHSNGQVDWASNVPGLCSTAPANGEYLGSSGDAANWRRIGYLKTDAATPTLATDWQLCGKGTDVFSKYLATDIVNSDVGSGFGTVVSMPLVAVMPRTRLLISTMGQIDKDTASLGLQLQLTINSVTTASMLSQDATANNIHTVTLSGIYSSTDVGAIEVLSEYWHTGAGSITTVYGDGSQESHINIMRITP